MENKKHCYLYAKSSGEFLVIKQMQNFILPLKIQVKDSSNKYIELELMGSLSGVFMKIYKLFFHRQITPIKPKLAFALGFCDTYIGRMILGFPYPEKMKGVQKLVELYFKYFPAQKILENKNDIEKKDVYTKDFDNFI